MKESRVHLDHLISRQSIRYIPPTETQKSPYFTSKIALNDDQDQKLRYSDISRKDGWFTLIHKPDFQRETNAWTPQTCVKFLESLVKGRIIPSIILWQNQENGLVYVLDGAHRLSIIRAWMMDDWGDKAGDYYERRDIVEIKKTGEITRALAKQEIGAYKDFEKGWYKNMEFTEQGKAPKLEMVQREYEQAMFYGKVTLSNATLSLQWERGNYEAAEQSFLYINKQGQALDPWEANLIEYRRSSYARCIMSIANGGDNGYYWPQPSEGNGSDELLKLAESFQDRAADIHKRLFVPPLRSTITNVNVPFMVSPKYFQKHKHLIEVIPLLVDRVIADTEEKQIELMKKDATDSSVTVIRNADRILSLMEQRLEHLISPTHNSKSLSIVPLFYWYNQRTSYARGLFYGFIYWMLAGSEKDITNRKILFSANRDTFEYVMFKLKRQIATLQEKGGAGLFATKRVGEFYQELLMLLHGDQSLGKDDPNLEDTVLTILKKRARITVSQSSKTKSSRTYSRSDKSKINMRELFQQAIRCHICGGIIDLEQGLQYDHVIDHAISKSTNIEDGKPTHPFCNRYKKEIQSYKTGQMNFELPDFEASIGREKAQSSQLSMFEYFGGDFPQ